MISHSATAADSDSFVPIGDSSDGITTKLLVHGMRQDCTGKGLAICIRQHLQKFCQVIHVSVRRNAAQRVRGGFVVALVRLGDIIGTLPDDMAKFTYQGTNLYVSLGCGDVRDALFPFLNHERRSLLRLDDICRYNLLSFACTVFALLIAGTCTHLLIRRSLSAFILRFVELFTRMMLHSGISLLGSKLLMRWHSCYACFAMWAPVQMVTSSCVMLLRVLEAILSLLPGLTFLSLPWR
jgi:hypothetical protein